MIDAALCGYEYSGLPKLLNVADHPRLKAGCRPMSVLKDTSVSVLFDIPGERAYRARARLAREGIEIDRHIHDALIQLAEGSATRQGAMQ